MRTAPRAGLFDGIKVLDLSDGIAGPFCARLLADFGADVLKVEPPEGDADRRLAPFAQDDPGSEKSLFFTLLNLNKRGITLALDTRLGREAFLRLVRGCDVVVESFAPGRLDALGLSWNTLAAENRHLILTSVTPFGQTGPYASYHGEEIVYYALGGIMSYSGSPEREPIKHGGVQAHYEGGLNAAAATAVALFQRERSSAGTHLDISIVQCVASTAIAAQAAYSFAGGIVGRPRAVAGPFNNVVPCKDGYVVLGVPNETAYAQMAEILDAPKMTEPPFDDPRTRREHPDELQAIVFEALQRKTRRELLEDERKPLIGMVQTPKDLAECPHLESRGFFQSVEQPSIGALAVPAALFNASLTPAELRLPAPKLGEHNLAVYEGELGYSRDDLRVMRESGAI